MCDQKCMNCIYYSPAYYECENDYIPKGYAVKNPDDGYDCDLFEPIEMKKEERT